MKVLAFGDSFVKMFIHCQPEVKHWKFKGKSMKGLVKEDDVQRRRVQTQIRKTPSGTKILMFFGQVDFNYVRYYKVIKQQPALTQQTFEKYVSWVSSMNTRGNISIVSIFPSPIKKERVINSLVNKGSYQQDERTIEIDNRILCEYDKSHDTWVLWNSWIRHYCQKYKVGNIQLFKQDHLDPQFYDISGLTIHLRYVPVLKLVKQYVNISIDLEKAEKIEKEYQKEKIDRVTNSIFRFDSSSSTYHQKCQLSAFQNQETNEMQAKQLTREQPHKAQTEVLVVDKGSSQPTESKRKNTADLDTDTHLEKQSERSKENDSKLSEETHPTRARSSSKERVDDDKKKKKAKKTKNPKQKQKQKQKAKKKYVCAESIQESEDEGERFLQLATKHRSR